MKKISTAERRKAAQDRMTQALCRFVKVDGFEAFGFHLRYHFEGDRTDLTERGKRCNQFLLWLAELMYGSESREYAAALYWAYDDQPRMLQRAIELYDEHGKMTQAQAEDTPYPWICLELAKHYRDAKRFEEGLAILKKLRTFDGRYCLEHLRFFEDDKDHNYGEWKLWHECREGLVNNIQEQYGEVSERGGAA